MVLKSKLTLARENYDLETDAGKEQYRADLAKHNRILREIKDYKNSQFYTSFNTIIDELKEKDPIQAQKILRAKESQDQRLRPVIADVFGAKDEKTTEKLREQEQELEKERRNATTPEERARLDQELKEVQEQRTRFEAWVKKHGGSDEDINAFQAKLEEFRTSDPKKYKKIMAELNRLADLKDSDPDTYAKEIERLRETGLINDTTGEIFAVLDISRETVGSQKDQEDYKKFNVFVTTNKEVAESRYGRKFESVKEVLEFKGYNSINDFLEQNGTATAEQEHFIKQNEFKYTPQKTNFQQEYYRQKYQSRVSTNQVEHRPSMGQRIANAEFAKENGLTPTPAGQTSASFQAKVKTIMQLEGVPREIAVLMAKGATLEEIIAYIEENSDREAVFASLSLGKEIENYKLSLGKYPSERNNIGIINARNSGLGTPEDYNFFGISFS